MSSKKNLPFVLGLLGALGVIAIGSLFLTPYFGLPGGLFYYTFYSLFFIPLISVLLSIKKPLLGAILLLIFLIPFVLFGIPFIFFYTLVMSGTAAAPLSASDMYLALLLILLPLISAAFLIVFIISLFLRNRREHK